MVYYWVVPRRGRGQARCWAQSGCHSVMSLSVDSGSAMLGVHWHVDSDVKLAALIKRHGQMVVEQARRTH
eukprot:3875659-Rhodomonas_salina.4